MQTFLDEYSFAVRRNSFYTVKELNKFTKKNRITLKIIDITNTFEYLLYSK